MALLFSSRTIRRRRGRAELRARIPDLDVRIWPEVGDPAAIDGVLVWRPPPGELRATPSCRLGPASTA